MMEQKSLISSIWIEGTGCDTDKTGWDIVRTGRSTGVSNRVCFLDLSRLLLARVLVSPSSTKHSVPLELVFLNIDLRLVYEDVVGGVETEVISGGRGKLS